LGVAESLTESDSCLTIFRGCRVVAYYKVAGAVAGTLIDGTMWVSYNADTGVYLCHAPITPEMFHACLASGAVSLASASDPVVPVPPPESPRVFHGPRLVREA